MLLFVCKTEMHEVIQKLNFLNYRHKILVHEFYGYVSSVMKYIVSNCKPYCVIFQSVYWLYN